MIVVERTGPQALLQDLGRPGHARFGVSPSGAADRVSHRRANALVGNDPMTATIEIVPPGFTCRFAEDTLVALAGAPAAATLDGVPAPFGAIDVAAGQRLALGPAPWGLRTYLAVRGGFDGDLVLGSRSTDVLGRLGPTPLTDGTTLTVEGAPALDADPPPALTEPPDPLVVSVLPTSGGERVDTSALDAAVATVSPSSSRVALVLDGVSLASRSAEQFPPQGIVRGAVQVPADGRPLVFLTDHPVTGGYPVIGVVPDALTDSLAQLQPGHSVRLEVQR